MILCVTNCKEVDEFPVVVKIFGLGLKVHEGLHTKLLELSGAVNLVRRLEKARTSLIKTGGGRMTFVDVGVVVFWGA